jgi:rhodanese-related sulfurtransferase
MIKQISPEEAARLLESGASLVDIREASERAAGLIPGSRHAPLSVLETAELTPTEQPVIFHCRSGGRTTTNAERLRQKAGGDDVYLLAGGIEAWRAAGLPVQRPE